MVSWQLASSLDKDYIFRLAENYGWYQDPPKVQVKAQKSGLSKDDVWWIIEPYEENCGCPDLVERPLKKPSED